MASVLDRLVDKALVSFWGKEEYREEDGSVSPWFSLCAAVEVIESTILSGKESFDLLVEISQLASRQELIQELEDCEDEPWRVQCVSLLEFAISEEMRVRDRRVEAEDNRRDEKFLGLHKS